MKTEIFEIFRVISGEHTNPHHMLGMHMVEKDEKPCVVVRAFLPNGISVTVVDAADEKRTFSLAKIHDDGFFEGILTGVEEWFRYELIYTDENGDTWKSRDPYSFMPTISEFDCHLFGAGTHYEIYEKMGGRLMEHEGVSGAGFTLWAPNALCVSVIGSFNGWNTHRHCMRRLGLSGIWEIFIPGLAAGDQYKFHVVQCNGVETDKTDPYGRFFQVRPETAAVLYDNTSYMWRDRRWFGKRKTKEGLLRAPASVYEVHLGSWMQGEGDTYLSYRELAHTLVAYLKEMNYNYIELLPVAEHPFDGSWGYQVTGYYAPTSRYGSPDDFKYFVDYCHQNHIGVILDWVPAHFPKDEFSFGRLDGTALYEHADPLKGEHRQWGTYIFNYGRKEVSNFLIANALFWLKEYHLDGLRVDAVASMLYLDFCKNDGEWTPNKYGGRENLEAVEFLKHMNAVIAKRHPCALVIAEESTSWAGVTAEIKDGGLGFGLKWNMGWMNDFLSYMKREYIYRKYHHNNLTFGMAYHHSERFMLVLSHDEVVHEKSAMIGKMPGDNWQRFANLRVGYGFMYGHPGKKLLFMGGEFGQYREWSETRSLDWGLLQYEEHHALQRYMKELNALYLSEDAFWIKDFDEDGFFWIDCDNEESSLVSFIRKGRKRELVFICNFMPTAYECFRLGVPKGRAYKEIFNSDEVRFGGSGVTNAGRLRVFADPWNGYDESIQLRIPPLGMIVLAKTR